MPCFDLYINLDESIPSRSRLYADSLPGIDSEMIEGITKASKDNDTTWAVLYKRACDGLVADVRKLTNAKFNTDLKLVARETSVFKQDVNLASGLSGVQIGFNLPKYARIHVISVTLFSDQAYDSPDVPIYVYDTDENGELLFETSGEISEGRNTIYIDRDFDVNKIFVAYDPDYAFRGTENKKYNSPYLSWSCDECRFDCGGYQGTVEQINGGGINVNYTVYCSIEKFVCDNINLFAQSLLWKIGITISHERRFGERLNKFTTMTLERAEELIGFYTEEYDKEVKETIKTHNIREDIYCFPCKHLVSKRTSLP
jgi:hypothetical protein